MRKKTDSDSVAGIVKMIEAGMKQRDIAAIVGMSDGYVSRISRVLDAVNKQDYQWLRYRRMEGEFRSAVDSVLDVKGVSIPDDVPAAPESEPQEAASTNVDYMNRYMEQLFQYMAALNKKLGELDTNLQKVLVDCQRQSNANTDVLMTELSKLTSLAEAIKCNTRRPK